jgi:UDP-N-acetyl-D-mannosaminuronic acid dehydrogenase
LPTSLLLAKSGFKVEGIDTNNKIIELLNSGRLPFKETGLDELFEKAKINFKASSNLGSSDAYIIAVPTPLDSAMKMADLSAVKNATFAISQVIKENQIVILESTVPPGTSDNLIIPILKEKQQKYFYFAHCPERAIPGKTINEMINNDRIIGGIDINSSNKVRDIYSSFIKGNIYITDTKTAEFVKLMENTFRDINIALANEFSLISEEVGINGWNAIELANKHPRVNILKPGPGVGGHCIAIDPLFLIEKSSKSRIVSLAREINDSMPMHVVNIIKDITKNIKNPTITLLGLSYKGNVDDTRESPSLKIKKIAENEGMSVNIYDPLIKNYNDNFSNLEDAVKNSDCIILVTDHDIFKDINPKFLSMKNKNLIDTRNILDHDKWKASGYNVKILGNGSPLS